MTMKFYSPIPVLDLRTMVYVIATLAQPGQIWSINRKNKIK